MSDELLILGVRHHGPGSARGVRGALEAFQPDVVLVEAPADAQPLIEFVADPALVPPVALLAYAADDPGVAAFWPMAEFSPEWQAMAWARRREEPVEVRCIDLPAAMLLAWDEAAFEGEALIGDDEDAGDETEPVLIAESPASEAPRVLDPVVELARAAGRADAESWWEDLVELRSDGPPFAAIADAIAELRALDGPPLVAPPPASPDADPSARPDLMAVREAHMRQAIRAARKDGCERIAVICGAFHAPALRDPLPPAAADARLLRGLAKRKVRTTWVPWTHGRLSSASGYGPGVAAPGWAAHCFVTPTDPARSWLTRVAVTLRARGSNTSTAHVIEAVRLADALTAMRGRPAPGLQEIRDATLAVLAEGDPVVARLAEEVLLVDEQQGMVPEGAPTVALEADMEARCKAVRLKRAPRPATKELDLRKPLDAARSALLHQVGLLGIDWAQPEEDQRRATGTFRETWAMHWDPELAVEVVDASRWGTTVAGAATAKVCSDALAADLPELARLLADALRADLEDALDPLLAAVDRRAAWETDLTPILGAIPSLIDTARYGDARGTPLPRLRVLVDGLVARACAGLPQALRGHDLDASRPLMGAVEQVHAALVVLADPLAHERWLAALAQSTGRVDVHPLLVGRIVRLQLDAGAITSEATAQSLARALSVGPDAETKAAWVEGFLAGGGLLLAHDPVLLGLLDDWLFGLEEYDLLVAIPLLRRAFGSLILVERRMLAERVRSLGGGAGPASPGSPAPAGLDVDRGAEAVARAASLLGLDAGAVLAGFRGADADAALGDQGSDQEEPA